jgi:hypothetical protein
MARWVWSWSRAAMGGRGACGVKGGFDRTLLEAAGSKTAERRKTPPRLRPGGAVWCDGLRWPGRKPQPGCGRQLVMRGSGPAHARSCGNRSAGPILGACQKEYDTSTPVPLHGASTLRDLLFSPKRRRRRTRKTGTVLTIHRQLVSMTAHSVAGVCGRGWCFAHVHDVGGIRIRPRSEIRDRGLWQEEGYRVREGRGGRHGRHVEERGVNVSGGEGRHQHGASGAHVGSQRHRSRLESKYGQRRLPRGSPPPPTRPQSCVTATRRHTP